MRDASAKFIISLDFELFWGVRDKRTVETYGENIRGVRKVIPALLDLFNRYEIQVTFATVGFLFARNREELLQYLPAVLPDYPDQKYSPYQNRYLEAVGNSEQDDIYHFGSSLVSLILRHPEHELASHTFSHYYCLEGASLQSFEEDLKSAKKIASAHNVDLRSIVFPRNQYSDAHIEVSRKLGFLAYRGNQRSSIYDPRKNKEQDKKTRALRLIDSYVNLSGHHSFDVEKRAIINIPASSFLRPYSKTLRFADSLRFERIKKSMTHAAKANESYHLWWHPHNFGTNLMENLAFLEEILKHYRRLHKEFGMESKTMKSIAEEILQPHEV